MGLDDNENYWQRDIQSKSYSQSKLSISFGRFINTSDSNMVKKLEERTDLLFESLKILKNNPLKSQQNIIKMRKSHIDVEQLYREGMIIVFKGRDPMRALKKRKVYHHIKNASVNLNLTVDIFHRIVVRRI